MKKRICPICDQVMTLPHYCETCRSFVKEPWIRDVTYHLNERHPENETGCSYHGGLEMDTSRDNIWDIISAKQAIQKRMAEHADQKEKEQARPNVPRDRAKPVRKISGTKIVLVILVIYIIFQILVTGFTVIGDVILNSFGQETEYDVDLGDYVGDHIGDGYTINTAGSNGDV